MILIIYHYLFNIPDTNYRLIIACSFLDRKKRILHSPNHLISSKSLLYLFIALGSISARAIIRSYK